MAAKTYSVGTSTLSVVPDFTGAQTAAKRFTDSLARDMAEALRGGMVNGLGNSGPAKAAAAKTGNSLGGTLADTIRGRLQAALRSLPKVDVDASTDAATRRIQELRGELSTLSSRVGVNLDSDQASTRIAAIEAELKGLSASSTDLDLKANTAQATRALELIRLEVERVKAAGGTVVVNADVGSFAAQVRRALERAQAALPKLEVGASTTPAQRELETLRARLEALSGKRIGVDIDAADALAELTALETQLTELAARTTDIDVDVNAAAAAAALAAVRAEVERLRAERVVIPVEVNAGRFVATATAAVAAAQAAIPDLAVGMNSTAAQVELAGLRADLERLGTYEIGVDISAGDFYAETQRIAERMRQLSTSTAEVDVKADAAAAAAELGAIDRLVERLDGKTARIDVDSTSLNTFTGRIVLLGTALTALAPAALPGLGAIVIGIGAIGAAAGAALPAIGALVLGFAGVGGALSAMAKRDEDAAKTAQQAAQQRASAAAQVASAQRSLEGAEASLANARASAAVAEQRSARAIIDARAAVAKAEADAADASQQAAQRVIDANDALALAVSEAAYDSEQSARRVTAAQRAVEQATTTAAAAVANAEQRAADARQRTAEVTERSTDAVTAALRKRESAERTLADQQQRSLDLEAALADARQSAAESLEDMGLRLTSNAIRAQQQQLDLADAVANLAKVQADPSSSAEDISRANLAVQSQRQAIAELEVSNRRLEVSYREAAAAGVEGSEQVKTAQQNIAEQAQRAAEAEQALADARQGVLDAQVKGLRDIVTAQREETAAATAATQARVDGAQQVADAEQSLADARVNADRQAAASTRELAAARRSADEAARAATEAQVDGAARVAAAEQAVTDAITARAEQQRSSAASLDSAQRGLEGSQAALATAYDTAGRAGVAATDEVAQAMAKLGIAGQGFALFLYGLRPQLETLQNAAAGGLLPGLQTAITNLLPLMPTFERLLATFGTALGQLAIDAAAALNGPAFSGFFAFLETNGPAIVETFGKIMGNVFGLFPALATAFGPIGQVVGDVLVGLGDQFNAFLTNLNGSDSFESFLNYVRDNGPAIGSFFSAFADAFVTLVRSAAPFGPLILGILTSVLELIAATPPGVIAAIVAAVLGIVAAVNIVVPIVSGLIGAFSAVWGIVTAFAAALGAEGLGAALATLIPGIGPIIAIILAIGGALVAAYLHSETFRDIVNGVFGAVRDFVVGVIWEGALKPTFEALATFFTETLPDAAMWLWQNGIKPAFDGVKSAVEVAIGVVRTVLDGLMWYWQNVLKPAALFLWHNVFEPVFAGIRFAVDVAIAFVKLYIDALVFFWKNVVQPAAMFLWHNVFEPVFSGIAAAVRFAWENVIRPALDALVGFWRNTLQPAAVFLRDNVFKPVFEGLGTAVRTTWENVIRPALQALAGFFTDTLKPAVERGVEGFKTAFALMQAAAAVPINFIIREVYTGGIKKLFDQVAQTIDSDARLPVLNEVKVPEVKLAKGGRVPGQSPTKTADNIPAMLTAREWVQPVQSVDYYGTGVMEAMRRRLIPREVFQQLASGGSVTGLVNLGKKLQGMGLRVSENAYFGGVTPGAHTPNGWHYKLGNAGAIDVNLGFGNPKGEREALDKAVAVAQAAGYRTIWQAAGHYDHAHADVGAGQSIGSSGSDRSLLGGLLDGVEALGSSASNVLGDLWNGAKDMLSPFTDAIGKITGGVGDSAFGKLTGDAARSTFNSVVEWVKGKAAAIFGGGQDKGAADDAPTPGGVARWRSTALEALRITGQPASWIGSLLRRMMQESSGDPNAENGWDSNAAKGKDWRSKGLMQVIGPTFRSNALPGYSSNIFDPLSNIIAAIRYTVGKYGSGPRGWDRAGGYALGGLVGDEPGQLGRPLLFDDGGRLPLGVSVVNNRTGTPEAVFNRHDERALLERASTPVPTTPTQVFGDVYPTQEVDVEVLFRRARFALAGGGLGG